MLPYDADKTLHREDHVVEYDKPFTNAQEDHVVEYDKPFTNAQSFSSTCVKEKKIL